MKEIALRERKDRENHEYMKNMIFGETPEFEEIMECMQRLEREINGL